MHSAAREALAGRPGPSLAAYLVALAVQLALVNALGVLGVLRVQPPPLSVTAALLGGLVFGVGMILGKG